jgi:hypothetical protein
MSAHTPGPWTVGEDGDVIWGPEWEGRSMEAFALMREELRRERALRAELLEALKALFDRANHHTCTEIGGWFTGNDENFETLRKAEQAIAKATGEQP